MEIITAVIPHYDDLDCLRTLLRSLDQEIAAAPGTPTRALVVDDATPEANDELQRLESRYAWLHVVHSATNQGPATARNQGAQRAKSEWIWFLDSDVCLEPGALAGLQQLLAELGSGWGVVAGVGLETRTRESFQRYKNYLEYCWQPPEGPTGTLDSKCFVVRREDFLGVGGFDARFGSPTVEDYDLGFRMAQAGLRLRYTHCVKIQHHHPSFARQWRDFYRRTQGWVALKARYGFSFDDNGTSLREAMLQALHLSVLASFVTGLLVPTLLPLCGMLSIAALALNRKMNLTLLRNGENTAFLLRCFGYSCALSLPIAAGVAVGSLRAWTGRD